LLLLIRKRAEIGRPINFIDVISDSAQGIDFNFLMHKIEVWTFL
jgi:hypothetical protein